MSSWKSIVACNFSTEMKKLFAFILAFFYLTSTIGANVHLHYCMDELINWGVVNNESVTCENCGMEKDDGCCKDEQKFLKNTSDQTIADGGLQLTPRQITDAPFAYTHLSEHHFFSLIEKNLFRHPPPIHSGVDILIQNSIFRI
jgi:hypothetical protein